MFNVVLNAPARFYAILFSFQYNYNTSTSTIRVDNEEDIGQLHKLVFEPVTLFNIYRVSNCNLALTFLYKHILANLFMIITNFIIHIW